jgi:hypothetical protein
MKKSLLIAACCAFMGGCATMDHPVTLTDVAAPAQKFVVYQTKPDSYPGYLAAEGNDFSCRYGIHHQSVEEFVPPKAQVFAALLAQARPEAVSHQVVLERFDIFFNRRLHMLHILGRGGLGGVAGAMVGDANQKAARQNATVFTTDKLLVDADPEAKRNAGENQVGCDNEHEGEYFPSEISGGHDVVVTWLRFSVDGKPYHFRTFYQFQPDFDKAKIAAGIKEAMTLSVQAIAPRIELAH